MMVRSEHDLPTIRVFLGRPPSGSTSSRSSPGGTEVVFQAVRGRGDAQEVARCSPEDLGLHGPETWADDAFGLPPHVLTALADTARGLGSASTEPSNALWLELPSPRGYLYVLPWERLLAPLGRPVLRLPNHTVRPRPASTGLEVAVVGASSDSFDVAPLLTEISTLWAERSGGSPTVHVFTDAVTLPRLKEPGLAPSVHAYEPGGAAGTESAGLSSRWLRWVRDTMRDRALDVVHLVGEGTLSGDRGGFAFPGLPAPDPDRHVSRVVGADEVTDFLVQTGAWALLLTGVKRESAAALRELADAVALARPGVALVSDLAADADGDQLARTVNMVFGNDTPVSSAMPGVTCWVHPRFVEYPEEQRDEMLLAEDGSSALVSDTMRAALDEQSTPVWLAAGTRFLETQQAAWLPDDPDEAVDPDALEALKSISALLEQHVGDRPPEAYS